MTLRAPSATGPPAHAHVGRGQPGQTLLTEDAVVAQFGGEHPGAQAVRAPASGRAVGGGARRVIIGDRPGAAGGDIDEAAVPASPAGAARRPAPSARHRRGSCRGRGGRGRGRRSSALVDCRSRSSALLTTSSAESAAASAAISSASSMSRRAAARPRRPPAPRATAAARSSSRAVSPTDASRPAASCRRTSTPGSHRAPRGDKSSAFPAVDSFTGDPLPVSPPKS